jgi:hypothetical protein
MSVSIQSLFTPDEFTLELEWLKARDVFLGYNGVNQNVKRALELAAASKHPACQWLTGVFAEKTVKRVKAARDVFLAEEKKSPASLCFAALLSDPVDNTLSRQSAELEYPFAQAQIAARTRPRKLREGNKRREELIRLAKSSASQREPDGFCWLPFGCCTTRSRFVDGKSW